jgi:hypothetical protein
VQGFAEEVSPHVDMAGPLCGQFLQRFVLVADNQHLRGGRVHHTFG